MAATPQPAASSSSSTISIPATAAIGGLTVTQPAQTATSFYKIAPNELITFAWSFQYLYSTPSALSVSAICANGYTYPVGASNGVIPGAATSVVWDPYAYNLANKATPLTEASYTLAIMDARGLAAPRVGGLFNPNTQLTFALYTTQPYTGLSSGWSCSGCNGASTTPLSGAFATVMITILCMFFSGFVFIRTAIHRQARD